MPTVDMSLKRETFESYLEGRVSEDDLRRGTQISAPADIRTDSLYRAANRPWGGGFSFGYRQNLGGPDGFILYQVSANASGSVFLRPNIWLTGALSADIINNYDKFRYDAPSRVQRVRTDIRKYLDTSEVTMPNLQVNVAGKLGKDLYGIAYAGYLEWMYAGVGGELLYRPMGQAWALGQISITYSNATSINTSVSATTVSRPGTPRSITPLMHKNVSSALFPLAATSQAIMVQPLMSHACSTMA